MDTASDVIAFYRKAVPTWEGKHPDWPSSEQSQDAVDRLIGLALDRVEFEDVPATVLDDLAVEYVCGDYL